MKIKYAENIPDFFQILENLFFFNFYANSIFEKFCEFLKDL